MIKEPAWDILGLALAANAAEGTPAYEKIEAKRLAAIEKFKSACHVDGGKCQCCGRKLPKAKS